MGLMENGGLSVADALALQDRGCCNNNDMGMFGGNGSWVFFLFFLLAWGNGGLGGLGGGNNAAMQGAMTRADLSNGLNQQDIFRNQAGIMQEISAFERDATNNWGNMKYDNLVGVNSINANINEFRADAAKCCCETNRNIDAIRYENARNTCDIINAGHADTQRIIDHMTNNEMQGLRDRLQSATFQLSQQQQTADLMGKLRPCPVPAYPSCSPYQVFPMGNGCGSY